jgi:hypothetical protein
MRRAINFGAKLKVWRLNKEFWSDILMITPLWKIGVQIKKITIESKPIVDRKTHAQSQVSYQNHSLVFFSSNFSSTHQHSA